MRREVRVAVAFAAVVVAVTVVGFTVGNPPGLLAFARDVTVAPNGDVLALDVQNRVIQEYSPSGRSLGAIGSGLGGEIALSGDGLAVTTRGEIAAGAGFHAVAVLSPSGRLLRVLGQTGPDRLALAGRFAAGPGDTLYVPDIGHCRIDLFGAAGSAPIRTFGRCGAGPGSTADPVAVAVRGTRVYVSDRSYDRIVVFSLAGRWRRTISGAPGVIDGPIALAVTPSGRIVVCEGIQRLLELTAAGQVIWSTEAAGMHGVDGVAIGPSGDIYVSSSASRIGVFDASGHLLGVLGGVLSLRHPQAPTLLGQ